MGEKAVKAAVLPVAIRIAMNSHNARAEAVSMLGECCDVNRRSRGYCAVAALAGALRLRAPSGAITGPTRIVSSGCNSMKTIRSATRSGGTASPGIGAGRFCSHIGVATAAGMSACTLTP